MVGLRVIGRDGGRPTVSAVAIRTVLRLVDWLPAFYLAGFVSMLATGARRQRLGDLAAGTHVPRATPIRHRGLAIAAVVSSVVLVQGGSAVYAAVSGGTDLDTAQLERLMAERWQVQGVHLDSARCPRGVEQRRGNNFQCTGRVADQDVTFQVTQLDDSGNVYFENVEVILFPSQIADAIAKQAGARLGRPVDVDCGHSPLLAKKVGSSFSCHASSSTGETATITVTVKDRNGTYDWTMTGLTAPGTPSATATASPGSEVIKIGTAEFAQYPDGLRVQVTSVRRTTFTDLSTDPGPGVIVTVRITNRTKSRLDLTLADVTLRYGADGVEADFVIDDTVHEFDGGLAAGRTATATYGFSVPRNQREVTVDVTPGADYDSSTFAGRIS